MGEFGATKGRENHSLRIGQVTSRSFPRLGFRGAAEKDFERVHFVGLQIRARIGADGEIIPHDVAQP